MDDGRGVLLEGAEAGGPRETGPRAFRDEAADMVARVFGPILKASEGGLGVFFDKVSNGEFGSEYLGESVLGLHRFFEVIEAMDGDIVGVGLVAEAGHTGRLLGGSGVLQGLDNDAGGGGKGLGEMGVERMCDVAGSGDEFQWSETL